MALRPVGKIRAIGKRGTDQPFTIQRQRGLYYYVAERLAKRLEKLNKAYKEARRRRPEPLEKIKIVGRRGVPGHYPFMLPGRKGRYVCILADHLQVLEQINEKCKKPTKRRKRAKKRKGAKKR